MHTLNSGLNAMQFDNYKHIATMSLGNAGRVLE